MLKYYLLENEFIKLHQFSKWYFLPLIVVLLHIVIVLISVQFPNLINITSSLIGEKGNVWVGICHFVFIISTIIMPLIANFLVVISFNIEEKNNMWKYLKALPITVFDIFLHKIIIISFYTFLIAILASLVIYLTSVIFFSQSDYKTISLLWFIPFANAVKIFTTTFCIISFQAMLCLLIRRQTILLIISFFMPFICLYDLFSFLPYGIPFLNFQYSQIYKIQNGLWYSIIQQYEIISLVESISFVGFVYAYFKVKKLQ